jgi:hypothetical protein
MKHYHHNQTSSRPHYHSQPKKSVGWDFRLIVPTFGVFLLFSLLEDSLYFGKEDGLYSYVESPPGNGKLISISNRKYTQLTVLDDLGLLVSISGS